MLKLISLFCLSLVVFGYSRDISSVTGVQRPNASPNVGSINGDCTVVAIKNHDNTGIEFYTALHCIAKCNDSRQIIIDEHLDEAIVAFPGGIAVIKGYQIPMAATCSIPSLDINPDYARLHLGNFVQNPNVYNMGINGFDRPLNIAQNINLKNIGYPSITTISNRVGDVFHISTSQNTTSDIEANQGYPTYGLNNSNIVAKIKTHPGESGGALVDNNTIYGILSGGSKKYSIYEAIQNVINHNNYSNMVNVVVDLTHNPYSYIIRIR